MTQKELWIRTIDNVRSYVADSAEEYKRKMVLLETELSTADAIFVYIQTTKLLTCMLESEEEMKNKTTKEA